MIDQNEAISLSLAIATAMRNNDKQSREMLYEDLSEEELKRVLRWTTRQLVTVFSALSFVTGVDQDIAWTTYCKDTATSLIEDENGQSS